MFIFLGYKQGVFWLNIAKFEVNLRYRYCSNLFRDVRKESEFRQYHYRNSTKSRKDKKKKWEREIFDFRQHHHRNSFCPDLLPSGCLKCECVQGKPIVAMALSKQGVFFFFGNCGNAIVGNGRKKKIVVAEITCEELKKKVLRL